MVVARVNDQVGRVLGDRYRLVAPIGVGASAQVFLADDVTLRRRVAVKLLHKGLADDDQFLKRFRAEAQAAAQLSHPHITAVYDWGQDDVPYIVSEYLGGGSLRAMLDREKTLSLSQVLLLGLETARALEFAHGRGFVHRDLKPANLLFGDDGRLRVADFGLARALAEAAWTEPQGAVLGTARYASPEQAQGHTVDGKADVYSLALVLVEAATGSVPFAADTTIATLMARVDHPLEPGAELGPLQQVLRRAGQPDPADRPDSGELVVALMARAEELERPEPFPLVGTEPISPDSVADVDPTQIGDAVVVTAADVEAVTATVAADAAAGAAPGGDGDDGDQPKRRRRWPWIALVVLLLGLAGAAAAYATWGVGGSTAVAVPDFSDSTKTEVRQVAETNGWVLVENELRESDTVEGQVIRQDPLPGEALEEGETLSVTFSRGPPVFVLPTGLVGLQQEEAEVLLQPAIEEGARLATTVEVFDEEIPVGQVMEVRVDGEVVDDTEEDREFEEGSFVELTVSSGPEPRTLENWVGMDFDDALADLGPLGLTGGKDEVFDDEVPEGQIISQSPEAGEQVAKGSNVAFVVSLGPRLVEVPTVTGDPVATACEKIEAQELVCGDVTGGATNPVTATVPAAGDAVRPGTTVDLTTG
jgi:serine/threonine-protein kinase